MVIVIDPGHGGSDRYNKGVSGKYVEADGNLDFAKRLVKYITPFADIVLTRTTDCSETLTERAMVAANHKADLFISIHSDASDNANAGSTSIYYSVNKPNDNAIGSVLGKAVANALGVQFRGAFTRRSTNYANRDYYTVIDVACQHSVPHEFILERAFHSNVNEEQILLNPNIMEKGAQALANAIKSIFVIDSKNSTVNSEHSGMLRKGDEGPETKALQEHLLTLGYKLPKYGADGGYGDETAAAVRQFEIDNHLSVDAVDNVIAGPEVLTKIAELIKAKTEPEILYRVFIDGKQIEAIKVKDEAIKYVTDAIKNNQATSGKVQTTTGVDIFTLEKPVPVPSKIPYRIRKTWADEKSQVGAYNDLNGAKTECNKYPGYFVFDNTGEIVYISPTQSSPVIQPPVPPKNPIMGDSVCTAEQMATMLLHNNNEPKLDGMPVLDFCKLYLSEGKTEGVRGDIAFCQSIKETGWFKFVGGQTTPEMHNYAGLGAVNGAKVGEGNRFATQQLGIRAQIQHLKAYASNNTLINLCVDVRFSLVQRNSCQNWEDLNGHWAVPGDTYGQDIIKLFEQLKATKADDFLSAKIADLTAQLKDRDVQIASLNNAIVQKDSQIENLTNKCLTIEKIIIEIDNDLDKMGGMLK